MHGRHFGCGEPPPPPLTFEALDFASLPKQRPEVHEVSPTEPSRLCWATVVGIRISQPDVANSSMIRGCGSGSLRSTRAPRYGLADYFHQSDRCHVSGDSDSADVDLATPR